MFQLGILFSDDSSKTFFEYRVQMLRRSFFQDSKLSLSIQNLQNSHQSFLLSLSVLFHSLCFPSPKLFSLHHSTSNSPHDTTILNEKSIRNASETSRNLAKTTQEGAKVNFPLSADYCPLSAPLYMLLMNDLITWN
jgi:hypothetical protein